MILEDSEAIINVPDGFDARKFNSNLALFTWDPDRTSPKLLLSDENTKCSSKDGSGFKTTLGTEKFTAGGRYYF